MLPFSKRSSREELGEAYSQPEAGPRQGGRGAERPRGRMVSFSDEKTMVMPPKPKAGGRGPQAQPAASAAPVPAPKAPKADRPRPPVHYSDERTVLRPMAPPPAAPELPASRQSRPAPAPAAYAASHNLATASTVPAVPSIAPVSRPSPDSTGGEVPAAVVSTRARLMPARPTFSWSAALVAMGVFVGLVSAVVARGDTDALIEATASFVDPSHQSAVKAATPAAPAMAAAAALPPGVTPAPVALPAPVAAAPVAAPVAPAAAPAAPAVAANTPPPAPVAAAPAPAPKAEAPKETKVAATPAPSPRRYTWAAPAPRTPAPERVVEKPAKVESKPVAVAAKDEPKADSKKERGSKKGLDAELDSASAADALARAQLEASMQ